MQKEIYPKLSELLVEADALRRRHRDELYAQNQRHDEEWLVLFEQAIAVQTACPHEHTEFLPHHWPPNGDLRCTDCGSESVDGAWFTRSILVKSF